MEIHLKFTKVSGAGNDFVIIDNISGDLELDRASLAITLCSRHEGVGGDGLLILEKSNAADFRMEYYNSDGTSGAMCGNGGRCVAQYAFRQKISGSRPRFEAVGGIYEAEVLGERVRLRMQEPSPIRKVEDILIDGKTHECFFVDTGAPHAVLFVKNLDAIDLNPVGKAIRTSPAFDPSGANVDFVELERNAVVKLRTYERGVEMETQACGTGAVASALVAHREFRRQSPIVVKVRSGETLVVYFTLRGTTYSNIILEGRASLTYAGMAVYDVTSHKLSAIC